MVDPDVREAEDEDVDCPVLTWVAKSDVAEVYALRLSSMASNQAQAACIHPTRWAVCLMATEGTLVSINYPESEKYALTMEMLQAEAVKRCQSCSLIHGRRVIIMQCTPTNKHESEQ